MNMLHRSLIIIISWFGSVTLQFIKSGDSDAYVGIDSLENQQYTSPYSNYNSATARNDFETLQGDPLNEQFYQRDDVLSEILRKRRTSEQKTEYGDKRWASNVVDSDNAYLQTKEPLAPYLLRNDDGDPENTTTNENYQKKKKVYFSPWGGKRDVSGNDHNMWTWKRSHNAREPSMPKRVRFSPWGGKRSGQMVYKSESKRPKIIFATSVPELMRIVSNYSPNSKRLNISGFHYIPVLDDRHPVNMLAYSDHVGERTIRDAMPFKKFLQLLPKLYKPGHPYADVNMKKDGKRKVKFSAWGGKRSPPIIGPIWTPVSDNLKDSSQDAILLIQNSNQNDNTD